MVGAGGGPSATNGFSKAKDKGGEKNDGTHMVGGGLDGAENRNTHSGGPIEKRATDYGTTYEGEVTVFCRR